MEMELAHQTADIRYRFRVFPVGVEDGAAACQAPDALFTQPVQQVGPAP
ncbi:hypothetical protein [Bacteroides fragilis]